VGRDVESMVRDLVELAVEMVRGERAEEVDEKARVAAEERLLDLLLPPTRGFTPAEPPEAAASRTRERMREELRAGRLDERIVELDTREAPMPSLEVIAGSSAEEISSNLKDMMGQFFQRGPKTRKLRVPEALAQLAAEEQAKLVDMESVGKTAVRRVEQSGIIFIDEIDKIASRDGGHGGHGPDVSREGVQRDILPIVEGTTVNTKHGFVRTDHILFIAAGAFHVSKPADLIPELQGRFPIRVELDALTRDDFVRILTEPRGSLVKQYTALLGAEDVTVSFTPEAIGRIADYAALVNDHAENIGARRLHTVMERLLDELSFEAPELRETTIVIDEGYVERMLADIVTNEDLSRYIL
jgi:ATP-dependent HslUV protease ATP-binding subunit HslU